MTIYCAAIDPVALGVRIGRKKKNLVFTIPDSRHQSSVRVYIILSRTDTSLLGTACCTWHLVLLHALFIGVELRLLIGASGVVRKKQQQPRQVPRASRVSWEVIPATLRRLAVSGTKCSRFIELV